MNFHKIVFLFVVILLLPGCGEKSENTTTKKTATPSPQKVEKTEPTLSAVYSHFDDLEFLFNHQNDTTYVINFWATWCAPCIAELPYFEDLNKMYKNEKVKVVLVSLDSSKKIDDKLRPFIKKEKLMSHVVALTDIDYNTWIDKVSPDWDGAIPATMIYNEEAAEFIMGEFDSYEELDEIVKSYIKT